MESFSDLTQDQGEVDFLVGGDTQMVPEVDLSAEESRPGAEVGEEGGQDEGGRREVSGKERRKRRRLRNEPRSIVGTCMRTCAC